MATVLAPPAHRVEVRRWWAVSRWHHSGGAPELPDTRPADVPKTPVTLQPERRWLLPTPHLRCGEQPGRRHSSHRTARPNVGPERQRRVRARQSGMAVLPRSVPTGVPDVPSLVHRSGTPVALWSVAP